MTPFADSYVGRLRRLVGSRLLLVPGARIVIENDSGEILLQKRSDFGVWGILGGNAEEGESLETSIVREVREETGIVVNDVRPYGFGSDPAVETHTFPNGDRCQFFSLNFYARSFVGVPRIADGESLALGWFDPAELPEMLPNMRRSLDAYVRFRSTGEFQLI